MGVEISIHADRACGSFSVVPVNAPTRTSSAELCSGCVGPKSTASIGWEGVSRTPLCEVRMPLAVSEAGYPEAASVLKRA